MAQTQAKHLMSIKSCAHAPPKPHFYLQRYGAIPFRKDVGRSQREYLGAGCRTRHHQSCFWTERTKWYHQCAYWPSYEIAFYVYFHWILKESVYYAHYDFVSRFNCNISEDAIMTMFNMLWGIVFRWSIMNSSPCFILLGNVCHGG